MIKVFGTVLNADKVPDSNGEIWDVDGITFDTVIPVTVGFEGLSIGKATLYKDGDKVIADFELHTIDGIPEFIPAVGGVIEERDGKTIKKCKITSVGISMANNQDPRIKPIKVKK